MGNGKDVTTGPWDKGREDTVEDGLVEVGALMEGWDGFVDCSPGFPGWSPCKVSELQADSDYSSSP